MSTNSGQVQVLDAVGDIVLWVSAWWASIDAVKVSAVASAGATVVLAVFAAVQIIQIRHDRATRRRAAFAGLRGEHAKVVHLSERWKEDIDLVDAAKRGLMEPDDIPLSDWITVMPLAGEVGGTATLIVALAYGRLWDAHFYARNLVRATEERRQLIASQAVTRDDKARKLKQWDEQAPRTIESLRKALSDAADALADALVSERFSDEPLVLPPHLQSDVVVKLREAVGYPAQGEPRRRRWWWPIGKR